MEKPLALRARMSSNNQRLAVERAGDRLVHVQDHGVTPRNVPKKHGLSKARDEHHGPSQGWRPQGHGEAGQPAKVAGKHGHQSYSKNCPNNQQDKHIVELPKNVRKDSELTIYIIHFIIKSQ